MIHNSFHNIHLNTAMLLSMVFAPEKAALADMFQTVALYKEQDNNAHMSMLEVHSNNTFILPPFLSIFKAENECDILYICTSGSLARFFLFFKRNLRFFSYK